MNIKVATFENPENWLDCPIEDFIEYLPALMLIICTGSVFPPLSVLNDLFSVGKMDSGMSGGLLWKPFTIAGNERLRLMKILSRKNKIQFIENEDLGSCVTYIEWSQKFLKSFRANQ